MKSIKKLLKSLIFGVSLTAAAVSQATIVQFQTSLGDIEVNLYDEATPETVENFLYYVSEGAYTDSIFHRSIPGFVIQGGGFNIVSEVVDRIPTVTSPINEPSFSSVSGTIAMAKLSGDSNSATNQWFFNLADNSTILDTQNGGFTVFGEITGGIEVVEAIASLNRYDFRLLSEVAFFEASSYVTAFSDTPLDGFTTDDLATLLTTPSEYLVTIGAIIVLDEAADTAASLNPAPNTLLIPEPNVPSDPEPAPVTPPKKKKKWYGSSDVSLLCLLLLFMLCMNHRKAIKHGI